MATLTHAVVNPTTGAVITPGTYNQTVVSEPTAPSTTSVFGPEFNYPLLREIVSRRIIDEPQLTQGITSARSFFTGDSLIDKSTLMSNLKFGQEIKVNILKDQNPFSLFQKREMTYKEVDACHSALDLDCTIPCVNTMPEFDHLTFRFDTEYSYGVKMCDKDTDFWNVEYYARQYTKSREAMEFGREVDLWNTVIRGLIAAPATTVDAKLAQLHPTHYWANLGDVTTNARCVVPEAYWYMYNNFTGLNLTVFVTEEFGTELVRSVETPYNLNFSTQRVNTFEQWTIPGFTINAAVKAIFGGIPVVVMKRSAWLTYAGGGSGEAGIVSQFPLWSQDGSKQYVAILDPRVGYEIAKDGYHLEIRPYDCDHLERGLQDTLYTGRGITFPQYGLVLEFDAFSYC